MAINLTKTTHSLIAYLAGAHSTRAPHYLVSYVARRAEDNVDESFSAAGDLNGASSVTLVTAPDGSIVLRKQIDEVLIHNDDTAGCTVTVALQDDSHEIVFVVKAIGAQETLHYSPSSGFSLFT